MFVFRLLKICYVQHIITSIHAALVRLNVSPQKVGFWEVQIERAIQRAQLLDDFDAEQVSEEKQDTKSELSNFERALRIGTRASQCKNGSQSYPNQQLRLSIGSYHSN